MRSKKTNHHNAHKFFICAKTHPFGLVKHQSRKLCLEGLVLAILSLVCGHFVVKIWCFSDSLERIFGCEEGTFVLYGKTNQTRHKHQDFVASCFIQVSPQTEQH